MEPAVFGPEPTQAEARLHRLERLQDVCRVVSSDLDLDQVLQFICDAVRDGFGLDRVALFQVDLRAQRILGPRAVCDETGREVMGRESVPPVASLELRPGASAAADVALGLIPYCLCNDAACGAADESTLASRGTRAGMEMERPLAVLPLRGRGRIVGLMRVTNPHSGRRLSDQDIEELRPFTEQAAVAIEHATFYAESQRRVGFLSALLQISTSLTSHSELTELLQGACDQLLKVSGLQIAAVYLVEPDGQTLRLQTTAGFQPAVPEFYEPFRIGERLAGLAAQERQVVIRRNLQRDDSLAAAMARRIGLQTVVCAPLLLRGELLGVFAAGTMDDTELTGEETDLVSSVSNQLAAAIANLRLLEETRVRMLEQQERGDQLAVLYHISRAMVATIGLEERLRVIAEGLTEVTRTTRCAIFRLDRDGLLPWVSYGDSAEEKRRFQALDVSAIDATRLLRAMSARKRPVPMRDITDEPFSQIPWLRAWGVRSALWLPLAFQNRLTGLAVVYQPGEQRVFHREQVRLAAAVANQAAIAIRVSQAYEHERNVAETLQRSFVPTIGARLKSFDLGQTYHPALKEAQVGGDFYDVFWLPDGRVGLLMADVSGKGLPAAIQTAMVKYMLRSYAIEDASPASVLMRLNRGLCAFIDPDLFVTAFYGLLCPDSGRLHYGNAGHDSPILALKQQDFCTSLDTTGPALGLDPAVAYFERTVHFNPGDLLLLYTDGVTDARRGDELFGRERLEELLAGLSDAKPNRIVSQIYRTVRAFAEGDLHDDCALLVLKAKEVWRHPAQP
jgi:sigma-B regulation protein RsbU (phosphoserine phosphatase)